MQFYSLIRAPFLRNLFTRVSDEITLLLDLSRSFVQNTKTVDEFNFKFFENLQNFWFICD